MNSFTKAFVSFIKVAITVQPPSQLGLAKQLHVAKGIFTKLWKCIVKGKMFFPKKWDAGAKKEVT
jgi:hypothetical protein